MDKKEFKKIFEPYAKNVDNANSLCFWKLSDDIITKIICKNIPKNISKKSIILDAGGGTGRWICNLSKIFPSNFILYDLSDDMLKRANVNISKAKIGNRVKIVKGDLTDMSSIETNSIDYIISIYSPVSFIYKKEMAAKEMHRVLKKGGKIMIMGHGYFNALYSKINNYIASPKEIEKVEKTFFVKWGEAVPKLNTFSKESIEKLLTDAGFNVSATYGIPIFVQPGPEDFYSENNKISRISSALKNANFYKTVLNLEMKYNSKPSVVNRGMNMLSVGFKKS